MILYRLYIKLLYCFFCCYLVDISEQRSQEGEWGGILWTTWTVVRLSFKVFQQQEKANCLSCYWADDSVDRVQLENSELMIHSWTKHSYSPDSLFVPGICAFVSVCLSASVLVLTLTQRRVVMSCHTVWRACTVVASCCLKLTELFKASTLTEQRYL